MKRINLDQNKWIDLAAARAGVAKGKRYSDVVAISAEGVDRSLLLFPSPASTTWRRTIVASGDLVEMLPQ